MTEQRKNVQEDAKIVSMIDIVNTEIPKLILFERSKRPVKFYTNRYKAGNLNAQIPLCQMSFLSLLGNLQLLSSRTHLFVVEMFD